MASAAFTNAKIVLENEIIDGSLRIEEGCIAAIDEGATAIGEDCHGDLLIPGLIELHTDHLEGHYAPRPGVRWNPVAAVQAHDAQIVASGITTVYDALRIGMDEDSRLQSSDMRTLADAIIHGSERGRLRADHFIHLRCEVSSPDAVEGFELFKDDDKVKLASLMDHTPGQRQFTSIDVYKRYYQGKTGMSDEEFELFVERRTKQSDAVAEPNRQQLAQLCQERGIILASHDDATEAHVAEAVDHKVLVAEFPTTVEAARASRENGMSVLMGAPNVVRGGSHSGNVSASDLADAGLLDILSSDYVPFSLLHAAFLLAERAGGDEALPASIKTVSTNAADVMGLDDRGRIAIGKRADVVRVTQAGEIPVVRAVYREGQRVL